MPKYLILLIASGMLTACATPPTVFTEVGAVNMPSQKTAQVIREFCLGGGRGLIHFDSVDGKSVRYQPQFQGGWPIKLVLLPGPHTIKLEYQAPDARLTATWKGKNEIDHDFIAGKVYLVRYRRESVAQYRMWLEELNESGDIDPLKPSCVQTEEFYDKRYIK